MNRRQLLKNYIIDKEFQYAYIARNLLLLLFISASIIVTTVIWNRVRFQQGFLIRPPTGEQVIQWAEKNRVSPTTAEFAYQFILQAKLYSFLDLIWKPVLAVFLINVLVLIVSGVYFSYKAAGPIYRLKKTLEQRIDGQDPGPFVFRKGDPFQELAVLLNKAFELNDRQRLDNKSGKVIP